MLLVVRGGFLRAVEVIHTSPLLFTHIISILRHCLCIALVKVQDIKISEYARVV